ncbi:hypothetical protein Tco_0485543 [Tanacetum coccineum]
MASLDHRLNPLFSIKEYSSCGALYTAHFCCSKGGLEDKILVPKPPQNCATCRDPVEGLYCRPCAFVRKCLNEGWYTIHDENEILNTSESSNHNTNILLDSQNELLNSQNELLNSQNEFLNSSNKLMEQMTTICDLVDQAIQKKEEEKRIAEEQAAEDRYWKIPICYDDDDDYTIAITPPLTL